MGSKSKAPPPPDYSSIAAASEKNAEWGYKAAELSQQTAMAQLDWAREQFAENKDLLERVLDTQLPIMESEAAEGAALRQRYNEVFQPIEDQLVKEASEYASGARADFEAGRAMGTVGQAFDAARSNALARMESYGIDPSQTRASALDAGIRVQEAAAKAAAGTQSRLNTENTGRALRGEAINIGRGLPGNIAGAYSTAMQAGGNSVGQANTSFSTGAGAMGNPTAWAGQGTSALGASNTALGNWSNTLSKGYEGQMSAYNAKQQNQRAMGSAIGGIAGMALGAYTGGFFAEGGEVPPDPADPSGKGDTIEARLSGGEHVIPTSVVRRLGSDHFDKLIAKHGDAEDSKAAMARLKTGAPGGEPVRASAMRARQDSVRANAMRAVA